MPLALAIIGVSRASRVKSHCALAAARLKATQAER